MSTANLLESAAMAIASGYYTDLLKLGNWLNAGVEQARRSNRSILVSFSHPVAELDPLAFFAHAQAGGQEAFFWERAEDSFGLAGAGSLITLTGQGAARFEQVERQWRELLEQAVIWREGIEGELWGVGPVLLGGFAFDAAATAGKLWEGFGDGALVLPEVQLVTRAGSTYLTLNALVNPATDPQTEAERLSRQCTRLCLPLPVEQTALAPLDPASHRLEDVLPAPAWKKLVGQAVDRIKAGVFEKVVLAREVQAVAPQPLDLVAALQRLRQNYASATIFAISRGQRCFLGATPERLVRLYEGEVRTIALAGSAPRGQDEAADRRLGRELLDSTKNRQEHAIVVRMLREALERLCTYVWSEDQPHLLKLANVQHLYTPVLGRLPEGVATGVLALVEKLHPTPALGGFPRREALEWLRGHEQLQRGWYAAPVGWVDSRGEGEFVVAIRSALVAGKTATLYAGCGIVADSDPDSEYQESCLKLKPMRTALGL